MAAPAYQLDYFILLLDRWRVEVLLVFLLIFVIIYAILQKSEILGAAKKNLNIVVSIVVGLLVVIPHITGRFPAYADPVLIISNALPSISVVLVAIIFLLILIGVFAQDKVFLGLSMPGWVAFFSFIVIILIFGGAAGWWSGYFGNTLTRFFGSESIAVVIMLLVFGIIIAWITSDSKEKEDRSTMGRLGADFSKLFGGGKGGH
ncbi:hypothetical protein CMO83_01335 [Candidatus Woesearchaeota archaeon]|nr:hypothetical protein [Candidatus Woesearchaeota archaeon]MDP6647957.1 hypothetical protein [Candidatus Woesearchaeota archaeon]|tara:strand:- start:540 stop:1151 length:612 start_codon:yes stop_codon:yes gene_type:complete